MPLSPGLPFCLAADADPGGGSGWASRPRWEGRAGHRGGRFWATGGRATGTSAGRRGCVAGASRGAGSKQRRQRTARCPRPSASPRILAEGAAAGPRLRLPGQPVRPWWPVGLRRQGSPVLPGRAGGTWEGDACASGAARGASRAGGAGTGTGERAGAGGGAAGTRVAATGEGAAPGALRRCGGGGRVPRPGRGALRTHRRRRSGGGRQAHGARPHSRTPARGSGPALSLPPPKVTSGAAVSRQLPRRLGSSEPLGSSPRPARPPCAWLFRAGGSKTE